MVLIGCISMSGGQKLGLQTAIFKNLVWNYKAQSFQFWYIALFRNFLPIFGYNNIMASPWPLTFSSGEWPILVVSLLVKATSVEPYSPRLSVFPSCSFVKTIVVWLLDPYNSVCCITCLYFSLYCLLLGSYIWYSK